MKYPTLQELNTSRELIDVFGGYNHNLRIGEGEFYEMQNLTSDDYPVLSPRSKRGVYKKEINPQGITAKDSLCYVDGNTLYINQANITDIAGDKMKLLSKCNDCPLKSTCNNFKEDSTHCPKSLISMGAYLIIMPDKKYINTSDYNDCGDIEASVTTTDDITFTLCKIDATEYEYSKVKPDNPKDGELWLDSDGDSYVLKQYSATDKTWSSVATTYIKISSLGIGKPFAVNDGVTISGITDTELKDLADTPIVVWERGDNYIVVKGIISDGFAQYASNPITVKREMPNMDFIIESNNRLWGCRYGVALNGNVVNEIYASKQGDFKNWNSFAGISTDSYVASVGTDGQFTGAITHLGYPLFFKENCIHKVYGNYPANYQIQTTPCRGVQKGCSKSLAIVNETLFYKSRSSVCAYDGSLPSEVSSALGDMHYGDAVAGTLGNKYYISMRDLNEKYHLFVFDTAKRMWHREDNTKVEDFCNCRGNLYYIEGDKIKTINPPTSTNEGEIEDTVIKWRAITGVIGTDAPDKKYISKLVVRLSLEVGTRVFFYIDYDSTGAWEHLFTMSGTNLRSFSVPVKPKRCDHMRLRIEGEGGAKIYSICKTIEQGSDV